MKKNKLVKFLILLFFLLEVRTTQAQQASTAAGGTATGSGGSATYSVGQVGYSFTTNISGSAGAGVQQAYEYFIGVDELHQITVSMQVFPNPVSSIVHIKIENNKWENLSYQLFDLSGRVVQSKKINGALTSISMENLDNADYFLSILNNTEEVKTFKLIKNN